MEQHFIDIYPEREANTGFDASANAVIRKRDGARIELNQTALVIWQLCDGTQSIDDIIEVVSSSYNLGRSDAIGSIVPLLQYLHDQQCLVLLRRKSGFSPPPAPPLVNFFPLPAALLETLEEYRHICDQFFPDSIDTDDNAMNEEKLAQAIDNQPVLIPDCSAYRDTKSLGLKALAPLLASITRQVHDLVPVNTAKLVNTGHALYGGGGSMGWHTNEDQPGLRIYCTWAEKAGTNYFRYRDPDSGEIVTLPEPQGWTVKSFYIPPRLRQFWHCLYAGSRRIAIGFAEHEFKRIDQIIES